MHLVLAVLGWCFVVIGGLLVISPPLGKRVSTLGAKNRVSRAWAPVTLGLTLLILWAAPASRYPLFILFLGALSALKVVYLLLMPRSQLEDVLTWWREMPDLTCRLWGLVTLAMGAAVLATR